MRGQKGIKILILVIALSFVNVKALSCNSSDNNMLNKAAYRVKVDYEVVDNSKKEQVSVHGNSTNYYLPNYKFIISIYNLDSPFIYVKVTDSFNGNIDYISADMANDGIYSFSDYNFNDINTYTFTIISATGQCVDETIKTLTLVKPKYNVFSEYDYCKDSKMYYCQKFITSDLSFVDEQGFFKTINVSSSDNNKEEYSLIKNLNNNKKIIIAAFIITVFISLIIIVIHKLKTRGDTI